MPLYSYHCNHCGADFDQSKSISERFSPTAEPCPTCQSVDSIALVVTNPRIVTGVGDVRSKTSQTFRDNMDRIKKLHPRNRIETA